MSKSILVIDTPEEEIWKEIYGTMGKYEVSSFRRIRSKRGVLKPALSSTGYFHVTLSVDGKRKDINIHRVVAETFIENPRHLSIVNHKDENKQNNRADNLEWCTQSYNISYGKAPKLLSDSMKRLFSDRNNHPRIRDVVCLESGKVWNCAKSAEEETGIDGSSIAKVCRGKRKTAGGFHWKYSCIDEILKVVNGNG